jgi:quercetin dioxygenase-like cupin family protein
MRISILKDTLSIYLLWLKRYGRPIVPGYVATSAVGCVVACVVAAFLAGPARAQDLRHLDAAAITALPQKTAEDGMKIRVLANGNGVTSVRVAVPPNADIAPHGHPPGKAALVTVLSGSIDLAICDLFDAARLRHVGAGEMVVLRATDGKHYARTGADGAELLLVAVPPEMVGPGLLEPR